MSRGRRGRGQNEVEGYPLGTLINVLNFNVPGGYPPPSPPQNGDWTGIRARYTLISEKLKQAGYATPGTGKW